MPPRVPSPAPEFDRQLDALGVALDATDRERLGAFLELLYAENETMNLTRIPPEEAWMRHIVDSLTLVPWLASLEADERPLRAIDVGSGGGVPGIPLAIVLPSILRAAEGVDAVGEPHGGARASRARAEFTLLEATGRKARFLERAVEALWLRGASVVAERAETAAHDRARHREQYDAVVSRAVGALPVLAELTLPFSRPGGFVMVIKGERAMAEVEEARHAIGLLGGAFIEARRTPTGTLVRIEKFSRTPRTYPRCPGEPARRPLRAPRRTGRERRP